MIVESRDKSLQNVLSGWNWMCRMQLDMDAKSMGYVHIKDSKEFEASERRLCWTKPRCVLAHASCILKCSQ